MRQVGLDGSSRQEQLVCDLWVASTFGGKPRDAKLTWCQGVRSTQTCSSRMCPAGNKFIVRPPREQLGAAAKGKVFCLPQPRPCFGTLAGTPQCSPKVGKGASVLESRR
jgi:hypothetical protein